MDAEWSRVGPRYVPRDYCSDPSKFGRDYRAWFRYPLDDAEGDRLARASELQHRFAVSVVTEMTRRGASRRTLAEKSGIQYHHLTKMLRGGVPMRLVHIAAISLAVGLPMPWEQVPLVSPTSTGGTDG